jgi:hypothetical protein
MFYSSMGKSDYSRAIASTCSSGEDLAKIIVTLSRFQSPGFNAIRGCFSCLSRLSTFICSPSHSLICLAILCRQPMESMLTMQSASSNCSNKEHVTRAAKRERLLSQVGKLPRIWQRLNCPNPSSTISRRFNDAPIRYVVILLRKCKNIRYIHLQNFSE